MIVQEVNIWIGRTEEIFIINFGSHDTEVKANKFRKKSYFFIWLKHIKNICEVSATYKYRSPLM